MLIVDFLRVVFRAGLVWLVVVGVGVVFVFSYWALGVGVGVGGLLPWLVGWYLEQPF